MLYKNIIPMLLFISHHALCQQVINGLSMPESVISSGKYFFVSNQGQDPFKQDGDGYISKIAPEGRLLDLKFLPAEGRLNAPKGMTILGDTLFVADLNRIVGFSITSRKTIFELDIPGATILNDICRTGKEEIAVTETASGNIYQINTRTKAYVTIGNLPAINGISFNERTGEMVVCTNGKNYGEGSVYIRTAYGDFKELANISNGFFDGIVFTDDSHLLISDWVTFPTCGFGKLWTYDLKNMQASFVFTEESTADFFFEPITQKIWLPQMFQNKLIITDIKKLFAYSRPRVNQLYNYGVIDAFIGGLYKGGLPVKNLKLKGDFGIGAPDMLNGELILIDGKAYQTKATGETVVVNDEYKTAFSSVTFFSADTTFFVSPAILRKALLDKIENNLINKNMMYAIKISGMFTHIKTRAFPPVEKPPYPALSTILDRQHFFNYRNTMGTLVGFHLPHYLNGINSSGFHMHYISSDKTKGGHALDFEGRGLKIEIAELKNITLAIPQEEGFQRFKFKTKNNEALERVEKGE